MIFRKARVVMVFGGSALVFPGRGWSLQPCIATESLIKPVLPLYLFNIPQNANAVRFDPVVLLIDNVRVRVTCVPGVQVLHKSPPVNVAPTMYKSFDVQELGSGKVVVVCATAEEEKNIAIKKNDSKVLTPFSSCVTLLNVVEKDLRLLH